MKIAITGHSAGIGQALARCYADRGQEIIGLSRRTGFNIKVLPRVVDAVEPCDVFINNAQVGFAQTELLFEMHRRWTGTNKTIINISTMMTQDPVSVLPDMDQYRIQKVALEQAVMQLRGKEGSPNLVIVRPGNIATSIDKTVPPAAEVDNWASVLVHALDMAQANGLTITDISLGPA